MEYPLVSAVVLCYNQARFVLECLEGIKAQDYPNLELIINDDASTDDSVAVIEGWLAKNPGIRHQFFRNQSNRGICRTLNNALAHCHGKYFAGIAADDVWLPGKLRVSLKPRTAGSDLLELAVTSADGEKKLDITFASIQDRRGRSILSVRDQNNFDLGFRRKRLMTLVQLFLLHRYKVDSVHYVTPTEDNQHQAEGMKTLGLFGSVVLEVGEIIVADVDKARLKQLLAPDRKALQALIDGK